MHLNPALSPIIFRRSVVQVLLHVDCFKFTECGSLQTFLSPHKGQGNAHEFKNTLRALIKARMPVPQRVRSGERSTSASPLCFPLISAPSPLAASGGEPSISRSNTLALVPESEGGQDKVGEKMLFKQPQCV